MIILMVSDFFYPNVGGVEQHMFQLSQFLIRRGHKVVVMTHAYEDRFGIRYMTNGLKVYYTSPRPFRDSNTWPTLFTNFPMVRDIILRERIDIVHCHQVRPCLPPGTTASCCLHCARSPRRKRMHVPRVPPTTRSGREN